MDSNGEPADNATLLEPAELERLLPSGRTLVVRAGAGGEVLEVLDSAGALELSISLTEDGPSVRIRATRIALESPETIALKCRRFEVDATEAVQLRSEGEARIDAREMRVRTRADIHLDGAMIRLNCDQAQALPDAPAVTGQPPGTDA